MLKLQNELAIKVAAAKNKTMQEFFEQEKDLEISIKFIQVEIESLQREREKISPQIEVDLSLEHVIMSQKRRLFINAIKVMNYNVEKWFQIKFRKYHAKSDEVLSVIRSLWRQPGRIREDGCLVEVEIEALDNRAMNKSLKQFVEELSQNKGLRMSDGRILRIKLTH